MTCTIGLIVAVALTMTGVGSREDESESTGDLSLEERGHRFADEEEDRANAARAKQLAKNPPSEASLGVPLYPGARFDPETSAAMSVGDGADYFVYLSRDPPQKVMAFYEKRTGKKGLGELGAGGVMFAVRGNPPWPKLGVTVQQNGVAEGWRKGMPTLITVRKSR